MVKEANGTQERPDSIQAEVLVYSGESCIAKYSITHGDYVVGRDMGCQLLLDVDGVSRHHARLTFQAYELVIEDLGSANGVFIEGVQVQLPTRVRPDQQVEIGSARLFIRLKAESSEMLTATLWDPDLGLAPVRALLEGRKHKVLGTIGGGGMGVVHQARDLRIRRTVAMKVIKTASQFSRENVLRFVEEAQVTGQLQHPNIVPVYDLALDEQGEVFYTMKYVKGITLHEVLRGIRKGDAEMLAKYPLAQLLTVFQKICDGVAFAHSMGVVHRDLKPDNVMVGEYGEVLVMDWGLAKKIAHGGGEKAEREGETRAPEPELRGFETLNGLIVGTPPYIAPEAARGDLDQMDARSDIYVLGAILYAILTLRPPYPGKDFAELIEQIVNGNFPHPSSYNQLARNNRTPSPAAPTPDGNDYVLAHLPGKRIPEGLAAVVLKAMGYHPDDRYQTVADLQADVIAWQGGFAPKAERASLKRQFMLWAARHKGYVGIIAIFALIFHVAVISLFLGLKHERDLAQKSEKEATENRDQLNAALEDLQGSAPLFFADAQKLIASKDFVTALDRIDTALRQVPNNADYHNLRGNILQTQLQWEDAIEAYEKALALNPKLASAKLNLELTAKLATGVDDEHDPSIELLRELHAALLKQTRLAEASSLSEKLGPERPLANKAIRKAIENNPEFAPLRDIVKNGELRFRITRLNDGTFHVNLNDLPLPAVLATLKAQPTSITSLTLDGMLIPDLILLQGMKLTALSLKNCRLITDLAPLRDMKLQRLNLSGTAIRDLSPLSGLPLVELNLAECGKLTDFRPLLACKALESLLLPANARDIAYLREHKTLKFLSTKPIPQPVADFWKDRDAKSVK